MKRLFVGILSLIAVSTIFVSCLKNSGDNPPAVVSPADQKAQIESFVSTSGYAMTEYKPNGQSTGIMYQIVNNGNNNGYGDTTNFRPSQSLKYITTVYTGKLLNGTTFDQATTDKPAKFPLYTTNSYGQNIIAVIPSFLEMVSLIGKGGHIRFVTPSYYAYANYAQSNIPANSPLFFDIQLLDVTAQ